MASWPSTWKTRVLTSLGVAVTQDALKVISAWQKSTPLDPWTNNPLGMPAKTGVVAPVPGTKYAMFRNIDDFYAAFAQFAKTPRGNAIKMAVNADRGYGATWRAISALDWPASATETDYPSAVLDLAGEAYAASVGARPADQRKSAGKPKAAPAVQEAMLHQARSIVSAAHTFRNASSATRFLLKGSARYGK